MSGMGRGRGRGRAAQRPGEMREPDKNTVEKIHQEKASLTTKTEDVPSSPPTADQTSETDSALTTIGEGKVPPAVQDVKDAIQDGVRMKEVYTQPTVALNYKQLDPSVPPFVPSSSSVSTHATATSKGLTPAYTKRTANSSSYHSSLNSSSNSSQLNPESNEFVPSSSISNGDPGFFGNGDLGEKEEEADQGWFDVKDIVRGFEWAAPKEMGDASCDPVLTAGAEMLLKVYNYPASFHEIGKKFETTLQSCSPSETALTNLAEMLIHWGVNTPAVRYSSCRLCFLICGMETVKRFKLFLMMRLREWHKKVFKELSTDEEKVIFVNFGGFLAEIYATIDVGGQPVKSLGPFIFCYVEKLLAMRSESFIREACQILKLTGRNLLTVPDYTKTMSELNTKMNDLTLDKSLSKTCTHLLMQVVELIGCNWGMAASPINPYPPSSDQQKAAPTTRLNTDAAPFVPSDQYDFGETVYIHQATDQPVAHVEDWYDYDFVGDDHPIEYTEDQDSANLIYAGLPGSDDDGLDPDIELEMEAFIDEIEEHLMLRDFDPDLHQDS